MDAKFKIVHETFISLYTSIYPLLEIEYQLSIFSKALSNHLQLIFCYDFLYMSSIS